MIKSVIAKGDQEYLNKLFETYLSIGDRKEILKVAGKIIQRSNKVPKTELIRIFDVIYENISKDRKVFRSIIDQEATETKNRNRRTSSFLAEYKIQLSRAYIEQIKKIIKDIRKGILSTREDSKEIYVFLNLSLADYCRYLCEVTINMVERIEAVREADDAYKAFFDLVNECNIHVVNPCSLTGYYHYAIFHFEILDEKIEAIRILKEKHQEIVEHLDMAYSLYIDCYTILDLITETLTIWVINTNYKNINNLS